MNKFIALLIVSCLVACSKPEPYEYRGSADLSIMSFNLRYDTSEDGDNQWENRKEACVKMIQETQPMIMGIQEGLYNQVNYLQGNMPNHAYVGVGRDDGHSGGEYSAIYYQKDRYELIETNNFWLSETPDYPSLGWDANNIRIATWVKLLDTVNNQEIFVLNTHLDHKGSQSREESIKLILDRVAQLTDSDDAVFLLGDYNALVSNDMFEPLLKQFRDARRFADFTDSDPSFNFFGRWYLERIIDFVFYRNADPLAFRTVNKDYGVPYISDHYPLLSHFNFID